MLHLPAIPLSHLRLVSMHRCLCIDELLRTIAVHIASQWPSRRALLYMALTCKTFYGPAMDTLWEDLPGLRPLLSLLPRDAYDFPKERIRFRGTIVESENPGSLVCTLMIGIRRPLDPDVTLEYYAYPDGGRVGSRTVHCKTFAWPVDALDR